MSRFVTSPAPSRLVLQGDWTLDNLKTIRRDLKKLAVNPEHDGSRFSVTASLDRLDTAGAAMLGHFPEIAGLGETQQALLDLVKSARQEYPPAKMPQPALFRSLAGLGKAAVASWHTLVDLVAFIGEVCVRLAALVRHPQRLRIRSLLRHIHETGVQAVPIVALIALLISIVLAYQGAGQLRRFGAEIFTINMVAISVLREMGVLLTAIMVAGRSGSAFTAEIGVMKVNEEIDAMKIMGIRPFEFLVIPRLLALMISLPLLTFVADIMGILGGGIISYFQMDLTPEQYLDRFQQAIRHSDFWVGVVKAPVFAFFIAIVGCMRGLQVSGSAESVGRLTTVAVVQSIFLVLLLDALFSVLFTKLGI